MGVSRTDAGILTWVCIGADNMVSVTQMINVTQKQGSLVRGGGSQGCREKGVPDYASQ